MMASQELNLLLSVAELTDGRVMDQRNKDRLRRENKRLRDRVEVLELEVQALRELAGE